jgi:uncharacterized protein YgbK (DUF1537 family)
MPHLDEVTSANSVFVDDAKFGRDPFFPNSKRRLPKVVTPVGPVTSSLQVLNNIVLKGISGLPGHRLAMLNNRTVAVGEETQFNFDNQPIKVRLIEIREKSVVLGMQGTAETKEIHLRAGL